MMENNPTSNTSMADRRGQMIDDEISIRELFDYFLLYWPWFLLSAAVCGTLMFFYLLKTPNVYERQAVLLSKEKPKGRMDTSTEALMQLNGVMLDSEVKNEMYILQSFPLAQDVVRSLHLDVSYTNISHYRKVSLYDERPFTVEFFSEFDKPVSFKAKVLDDQQVAIYDVRSELLGETIYSKTVRMGENISAPFGTFMV
ncbi:MAG: hypothetical protein HUK03_10520, partial [Bacteroidaceae bacterium]|nr:hypothetical protein [Bacteroidaceae bacterium]